MTSNALLRRRDPTTDSPIESEHDYITRMSQKLPGWPEDALRQFFLDHSDEVHIKQWSWLGYETLRYEIADWRTSEFTHKGLRDAGGIADWVNRLLPSRHRSDRFKRIEEYMREHGTWPRPIMFLSNPHDRVRDDMGRQVGCPWHLIEGNHRLAMLLFLRGTAPLKDTHQVWIIKKQG